MAASSGCDIEEPRARTTRPGFTLIELLVVISIIALLLAILLPVLGHARRTARGVICGGNLHQMGLALAMYADDNGQRLFPERENLPSGVLFWFGYEANGGPTAEGERVLDRTRGRLWSYYRTPDTIEICPSFPVDSANYKPKFATNWTTYGLPRTLIEPAAPGPASLRALRRPSDTLAFADTAQINAFQAPASPANPMFEQWHYLVGGQRMVLYSHQLRANAAMFDGHVRQLEPEFGVSPTFPEAPIGRPPSDVLLRID